MRPTTDQPVPIAFGYHPYLRLPGVAREDWLVESRSASSCASTRRCCPPASGWTRVIPGRLGDRTFDDAFVAPAGAAPFVLEGGGRRIELAFVEGYPYAQVFAPAEDDVIAFEPMTAPTNALVDGGAELPVLAPGESYRAGSRSRWPTRA